jgi:hypothetical protein
LWQQWLILKDPCNPSPCTDYNLISSYLFTPCFHILMTIWKEQKQWHHMKNQDL